MSMLKNGAPPYVENAPPHIKPILNEYKEHWLRIPPLAKPNHRLTAQLRESCTRMIACINKRQQRWCITFKKPFIYIPIEHNIFAILVKSLSAGCKLTASHAQRRCPFALRVRINSAKQVKILWPNYITLAP